MSTSARRCPSGSKNRVVELTAAGRRLAAASKDASRATVNTVAVKWRVWKVSASCARTRVLGERYGQVMDFVAATLSATTVDAAGARWSRGGLRARRAGPQMFWPQLGGTA